MSPDKKVTVEDALETIYSVIADFNNILEKDMYITPHNLDRMVEILESFVLLRDVVNINCEPSNEEEKCHEKDLESVLQIDWFDLLATDPAKFDRMKKICENNSLRLRICGKLEGRIFADIDLSGVDLSGSVFQNCHFNGCNFHDSRLHFVAFTYSYLSYCSFVDADLEGMEVSNCFVRGLNLTDARMKKSKWLKNKTHDTPLYFKDGDEAVVMENIMVSSGTPLTVESSGAESLQEKLEAIKKRINELEK